MPSGFADKKGSTAGDMTPFIIFMAFVILTTVIVISIYRINTEEDTSDVSDNPRITLALNAREPVAFSDDFLFPGFFPISAEDGQGAPPNVQSGVVEARRLLTDGKCDRTEDSLRTLLLFYPDDVEIIYLLSSVLHATGRDDEAGYYDERLSFLLPSPMPERLPSLTDGREKRTGP